MKKFFNISEGYRFELGDLWALLMVINVALVITVGFYSALLGIPVAVFGLVYDCRNENRHINDLLIHFATLIMNLYFFSQLF